MTKANVLNGAQAPRATDSAVAKRTSDGLRWVERWVALAVLLTVWQAATYYGWVRAVFLPSPAVVVHTLWQLVGTGELFVTLGTSLWRACAGVALAALVGIPAGLLMAESRFARWWLSPYIAFGFPLPKIALIPVFTAWFGMDSLSKVVLVFATCVFPFIVAAHAGAALISQKLRWAALSLGTTRGELFRLILLPATVPSMLSGLRIALPIGLITVFTAEMVTGGGLGEAIVQAQRYFQSPQVYAYVIVTMIVGYLADAGIAALQRRFAAWATE
ncbi:Putative aliphatic sulfonates transport permease protein SsuC [Pandoraea pneumonica]|uniref:Aliphatic sulfonates transport permease protein SsuC n=1 Tax=Pandoraea pneumonica TaxID=2508299 RepID=A0A5E4S6V8_9BURK|nr:ABC transporter permease [Pandoraea pneumonica]VVD71310.1 Putative aliphatic sulfonates transport permease protein SsuC [Pandoraea pneumonica]